MFAEVLGAMAGYRPRQENLDGGPGESAIGARAENIAHTEEKNKISAIGGSVTAINRSIIRFSNDIMDEIKAAVPRHLPRDPRDDAIQKHKNSGDCTAVKAPRYARRPRVDFPPDHREGSRPTNPGAFLAKH
jgi:hypothetical protein